MQLVNDGVSMYDAMKDVHIGAEKVFEKFGVTPEQVIEVQALIGDSSDNVPGVPGIGPKIAAELIQKYDTLENLLTHAGEITQPKRRQNLLDFAETARIAKRLVTLRADCENIPPLEDFLRREFDVAELVAFLREQNFKSLVGKFEGKVKSSAHVEASLSPTLSQGERGQYSLIGDIKILEQWFNEAQATGYIAFDVETNSLNARSAELVGFSICSSAGKAAYIPLTHKQAGSAAQGDLFAETQMPKLLDGQIELTSALKLLKPILENPAILKIGHNIKYDMLVMRNYGIDICAIEDTMLLSYCLSAGLNLQNMDALAQEHLRITPITYNEVTKKGKITFDYVDLAAATDYAAEDADVTLRLWQLLKPQLLEEKLTHLYETFERKLIPVIVEMEHNGILVDKAQLVSLSSDFGKEMAILESSIHQLAGRPFNLASPKQLGEILFDEMGLGGGKKTKKTENYATGSDVLEELAAQGHELPAKILEWRQLAKLKSTYTDALVNQINPTTQRVHTSYAMAVTSTGRLSSSDPNLQNIPIRSVQGKRIREAFIADAGFSLMSADYSQIELRLLAHVAEIETLKQAFRDGKDIHSATAAQIFGVSLEAVTPDMRRQAKTINFGIIYGISAHGLSSRLGIDRKQAAEYIELYFAQYPGIKNYMEKTKEEARAQGFVSTIWGRRCYVRGINDKNGNIRSFAERAAINAPLQGSAADIIKRAMIATQQELWKKSAKSRLLLQVHDELVFEIADEERDWLPASIKKLMEQAADLSVPLVVDTGIGEHWGAIH